MHGWPQHWWAWRGVIPVLARTHRVICPDLRGFGWSGQPADDDFRKERLADDQLALLDVLGIERAGFLGHDWGGWAGWLLARPRARADHAADDVSDRFTVVRSRARVRGTPGGSLTSGCSRCPCSGRRSCATAASRAAPARRMGAAVAAVYADVAARSRPRAGVEPAVPRTSSCASCRRCGAAGSTRDGLQVPVKVLFRARDAAQAAASCPGLEAHAPPSSTSRSSTAGTSCSTSGRELVADRATRVVRLISWNVARRVQALAAQAAALAAREPDVVALQEVTARTLPLWEAALGDARPR